MEDARGVLLIVGLVIISVVLLSINQPKEIEYKEFDVTVIDTDFDNGSLVPIRSGQVTYYKHAEDKYNVTVEFDGKNYIIDNKKYYYKFKVGEKVKGVFEISKYDSGDKWVLIELK